MKTIAALLVGLAALWLWRRVARREFRPSRDLEDELDRIDTIIAQERNAREDGS